MNDMNHAINSSDVLGRPFAAYDAHIMSRLARAVTVVFWPAGACVSEWSYLQPEASDEDMCSTVAKGGQGTVWIYRGQRHVNTCRNTPSAEYKV